MNFVVIVVAVMVVHSCYCCCCFCRGCCWCIFCLLLKLLFDGCLLLCLFVDAAAVLMLLLCSCCYYCCFRCCCWCCFSFVAVIAVLLGIQSLHLVWAPQDSKFRQIQRKGVRRLTPGNTLEYSSTTQASDERNKVHMI